MRALWTVAPLACMSAPAVASKAIGVGAGKLIEQVAGWAVRLTGAPDAI